MHTKFPNSDLCLVNSHRYQSKKGDKDQELIQSSTTMTQDTTWESDKNTIKHHK